MFPRVFPDSQTTLVAPYKYSFRVCALHCPFMSFVTVIIHCVLVVFNVCILHCTEHFMISGSEYLDISMSRAFHFVECSISNIYLLNKRMKFTFSQM